MRNEGEARQGGNIRVELRQVPWLQTRTSSVLGEQSAEATKYFGALPLFEKPQIEASQPQLQ